MKRSCKAIGLFILFLAAGGAYASSMKRTSNTYWYKSWIFFCNAIVVEFTCVEDPLGGCVGPIGSVPAGEQLYLTADCDRPLRQE